jgi:hypothetical protein
VDSNASVYNGNTGIITPRSGATRYTDIRFYNFPAQTTILKTCSFNDNPELFTTRGVEVFLSQIKFANISGKYL